MSWNWKLDQHLNQVGKKADALEKFQITDHRTLGVFGGRLLSVAEKFEAATELIEQGKGSSAQIQVFRELVPRLAALSEKVFRSLGGPGQ
jgi:hypothetical protein